MWQGPTINILQYDVRSQSEQASLACYKCLFHYAADSYRHKQRISGRSKRVIWRKQISYNCLSAWLLCAFKLRKIVTVGIICIHRRFPYITRLSNS